MPQCVRGYPANYGKANKENIGRKQSGNHSAAGSVMDCTEVTFGLANNLSLLTPP